MSIRECKNYHENGQLWAHYFYKDGKYHGEYKYWNEDGGLWRHCFYKDSIDITTSVKELCNDILAITDEEKLLIKLKFGIGCL